MKRAAVAVVVALLGTARADDEPDEPPGWQGGIGIHGLGMMQVGRWDAMNLGFAALAGIRFDRLALLGEADLETLWAARWTRGSIRGPGGDDLGGSLLRVAVVARYAFASYLGAWNRYGQRVNHQLYADGAVGEERVAVDTAATRARHDIALGIGYLTLIRFRSGGHFATFYAMHVRYAPGFATPDPFMQCPTCATETGGRDIGVSFDLGVLFGR